MLGVRGACRQPTAISSCHPRCACLSSVPDQVPRWAVQIAVKETGFFNSTRNSIFSAPNTNLQPVWYYAAAFVEVMAFLWNKDGPKVDRK